MGSRIRRLRLAKGWGQREFARRVGCLQVSVTHWETGATKNMRVLTFLKIARVLDVDPHFLAKGRRPKMKDPDDAPDMSGPDFWRRGIFRIGGRVVSREEWAAAMRERLKKKS